MKFACPHCQQHISADDGYAGVQINCPSCNGSLVVPSPAVPATPAAPAVVESTPPPVPAPSRLSIRSSAPAIPPSAAATSAPSAAGGCPSCGIALARGAVLCTNCGYNLVTRQRTVAGRPAAMGKPQVQDDGEAPWYKTPWPYLGIAVLLLGVFYLLGKQNPVFYLGMAAILIIYYLATTVLVLIAAFKESVTTGLLTLCFFPYALYFVFKVNEDDTLKILYAFNVVIIIGIKFMGAFAGS